MSRSSRVLLAAALCAALLLSIAPLAMAAPSSGPPPGWVQIAKNGIDNPGDAALFPFTNFNGRQYFWTPDMGSNGTSPPAPVWTYDGNKFSRAAADGFGDANNTSITPGCEFQGKFYMGTGNNGTGAAQLWRTADNSHWERVGATFFTDPADNNCLPLGVQGGKLIIEMDNYQVGCQAWSYDGTTFTRVNTDGFGVNGGSTSNAVVFKGKIHVVITRRSQQGPNPPLIPLVYMGGTTWTPTGPDGFGDTNNEASHIMVTDGTQIYTGTDNQNGGQVWRYDGSSWKKVNLGSIQTPSIALSFLFKGRLCVSTINTTASATGMTNGLPLGTGRVFGDGAPSGIGHMYLQNPDGSFETVSLDGFGDPNNIILVLGPAINGDILVGTANMNGFQVFETTSGPNITGLDPTSGPYGTPVTITGTDFGSAGTASYVNFAGGVVSAADADSWSDTKIVARVPEGANAGPVTVATAAGVSNGVDFTPTLSRTFYFAEGSTRDNATDGRFDEYLCIMNPNKDSTNVGVTFMTAVGTQKYEVYAVGGSTRKTINVADVIGRGQDVSLALVSDLPIAAERSMYFNYHSKWNGGHAVAGAPNPSESWYFAEGTTRDNPRDGSFDEWLCIANPNDRNATATITYNASGTPVVVKASVPPFSRITRDVAADVGRDKDVSLTVKSDLPLVAERPEYFNYHGIWAGGDTTLGATDPARDFYFSEGCTYSWACEWVCIANPGTVDAHVGVTYQMAGGTHATSSLTVPAGKRYTLDVASAIGLDKDVSVALHSDAPVVAERSQYFSYGPGWDGGAFGGGAPAPREKYYFAEGTTRSNTTDGSFDEWLTIENPNGQAAAITLTFVKPDGINIVQIITVGPGTRSTVSVNSVLGPDMDASLILTSSVPVVTERPMYFNYKGFAQGGSDTRGYGL